MVYDLIASHGDVEDLVFFAVLMQGTTIVIKHVFYALTSAGPRRALKAGVLRTLMLMYQKTMFDHYYCIKSFWYLKTLDKRFEKFIFVIL